MSEALSEKIDLLLERTGLAAELRAEVERDRAERSAAARLAKREAIAKFVKERDRLKPLRDDAEQKQRDAQKAAEAAMQEWIRAAEAFSAAHDVLSRATEQYDAELRANAHPAIAGLVDELRQAIAATAETSRFVPDAQGKTLGMDRQRYRDIGPQLDRRVRQLLKLIDEAERIAIDPEIDDEIAAIERIRAAAQEA